MQVNRKLLSLLLVFVAVTFLLLGPGGVVAVSGSWTQTSKDDFESGTLDGLDASTSPGDVTVALGANPPVRLGFPAVDRANSCCSADWTLIFTNAGQESPVSGRIVRFRIYAATVGPAPLLRFKVYSDNGTHYVMKGDTTVQSLSAGYNSISVSFPKLIERGDLLGFYKNADVVLDYDSPAEACAWRNGDIGVNDQMPKSAWNTSCAGRYSVEAEIVPDVAGILQSMVKDTGGHSIWQTINWTVSTPQGASVSFRTRSSNDSITWSSWSGEYTSTGSSIVSPAGRYIQYRTSLAASANSSGVINTPVLLDVTISFDTASTTSVEDRLGTATLLATVAIVLATVASGMGLYGISRARVRPK